MSWKDIESKIFENNLHGNETFPNIKIRKYSRLKEIQNNSTTTKKNIQSEENGLFVQRKYNRKCTPEILEKINNKKKNLLKNEHDSQSDFDLTKQNVLKTKYKRNIEEKGLKSLKDKMANKVNLNMPKLLKNPEIISKSTDLEPKFQRKKKIAGNLNSDMQLPEFYSTSILKKPESIKQKRKSIEPKSRNPSGQLEVDSSAKKLENMFEKIPQSNFKLKDMKPENIKQKRNSVEPKPRNQSRQLEVDSSAKKLENMHDKIPHKIKLYSKLKDMKPENTKQKRNSVEPKSRNQSSQLKLDSSAKKLENMHEKVPHKIKLNSKLNDMKSVLSNSDTPKRLKGDKKENNKKHKEMKAKMKPKFKNKHHDTQSDSDLSDWKEVDELTEILKNAEVSQSLKNDNLKIEFSSNLMSRARQIKKTEAELIEDYLRKEINRSTRELYIKMHITHILCLLAHGMYLNSVICCDNLMSLGRVLLPKSYYLPKRLDLAHIEKFLHWFNKTILISNETFPVPVSDCYEDILKDRLQKKKAKNNKEIVLMFVIISRAAGMTVRLIQNFNAMSWKSPFSSLIKPKKNEPSLDGISKMYEKNSDSKIVANSCNENLEKNLKIVKKNFKKVLNVTDNIEINYSDLFGKEKGKKMKQKWNNIKIDTDSEYLSSEDSDFDIVNEAKKKKRIKKSTIKSKNSSLSKSNIKQLESSQICEFKKDKVDLNEINKKDIFNDWVEIYCEDEEMWISVDVLRNKYHCTQEIEARCTNLSYVVAFNQDQFVKDVTKRYVSNWLSSKKKIQYDQNWWKKTLKSFTNPLSKKDKQEDEDLNEKLENQPLPKSICEYKNHPLYALERHLLKFEAFYPRDVKPIGQCKSESVYPRSSVKTLHSKDIWLKQAKSIKDGEEPYKIVKARPKWDKNSGVLVKDLPLEVFGDWQIKDYEPPTAVNGIVPRNQYGNVDLFKPCMLPNGCVHLPLTGLSRVARKLHIDCAAAMVGFEFKRGMTYPLMDGFVVCAQFKDILLDAWKQDQVEQRKKEEEKRINRIYDNWKKLIKGVVLKDRLKEKYYEILKEEKLKLEAENKNKKKKLPKIDNENIPSTSGCTKNKCLKVDMEACVPDLEKAKRKRKETRRIEKVKDTQDERGVDSTKSKSKGQRQRGIPEGQSDPLDSIATKEDNAKASSTAQNCDPGNFGSESEGEVGFEQKKEKIRKILEWAPENSQFNFESNLSDEDSEFGESSDLDESNSCRKNRKFSKIKARNKHIAANIGKITPQSEFNSQNSRQKMLTNSKKVLKRRASEDSDSSCPSPIKRRSLRVKTKPLKYKEEKVNSDDLSLSDSDCDKIYKPGRNNSSDDFE